ncbi:hypothetical protein [Caldisericum exile]|uniref:Uncharacterized protein n=1 Tax=Caldisericum exile (strain DSM 21853 / NBRC 104410 / AZM16c01) TaxID=511051 RepID=A0A7U6GFH9_CALEA|nr:hypothetical protein [Caldisericum exile]BAL81444.1 hypothetical protein CSE_13180 [Caldisericum exile AZM16c01]
MKKGYILIVTTVVIALILTGLLYATSVWLRTHAMELSEISQREIALYVAQYGINEMIYNLNAGSSYSNGQSISGTTPSGYSYTATYYTGDTFGGIGYIKGVGTVGNFTRTVYGSIIGGSSSEAFKYCLYTQTGKYTKTNSNSNIITMNNPIYNLTYNLEPASVPIPDFASYTNPNNYPANTFKKRNYSSDNVTYRVFIDANKVVFLNYTGSSPSATLTIDFAHNSATSVNITIITNFPAVKFIHLGTKANEIEGRDFSWNPISYNQTTKYPVFIHYPTLTSNSSVNLNLDYLGNDGNTFTINGLFYSNSNVSIEYGGFYWGFVNFKAPLFAKSLSTDWDYLEVLIDLNNDSRLTTETIFDYTLDTFKYPPPYFMGTSGYSYLVGSYREEY